VAAEVHQVDARGDVVVGDDVDDRRAVDDERAVEEDVAAGVQLAADERVGAGLRQRRPPRPAATRARP
jgi:hypothetical protein